MRRGILTANSAGPRNYAAVCWAGISAETFEAVPPGQVRAILEYRVFDDPGQAMDTEGYFELTAAVAAFVDTYRELPFVSLGFTPATSGLGQALTSMFVHGGILHLLFNMLFLFVAGSALELFWKRPALFAGYLFTGIVSVYVHKAMDPSSTIPLVGASGAIAGLMGALLASRPTLMVRMLAGVWIYITAFTTTFSVPAWVLLPIWFVGELAAAAGGVTDGVAYWAHVGGFVAGGLLGLAARYSGELMLTEPPPEEDTEILGVLRRDRPGRHDPTKRSADRPYKFRKD